MRLRLTVRDDDVIADFTGSARQAVGPVNAIYAVTASAVYNAIQDKFFKELDSRDLLEAAWEGARRALAGPRAFIPR